MTLSRRSFIKGLAALPLVVAFLPKEVPRPEPDFTRLTDCWDGDGWKHTNEQCISGWVREDGGKWGYVYKNIKTPDGVAIDPREILISEYRKGNFIS